MRGDPVLVGDPSRFGTALTDHMATATWCPDSGWGEPEIRPRGDLHLDAAAVGLHYGQAVFEGLKAYRREDGRFGIFRPDAYARRLRHSASRMMIPQPPGDLFVAALDMLVRQDSGLVPDDSAFDLYLRPLVVADEPTLSLRPARRFLFVVMAFVTGTFFSTGGRPVSVWVSRDFVRAVAGGVGDVKWPGNYAPAFMAQEQAAQRGCDQVVWLDATERRWVEEMGGMNLFFVHRTDGPPRISTPPLTGTILPGVTRDCLLSLGPELGLVTEEKRITVDEWRSGSRSGAITETIACGTAAAVTSVGRVRDGDGEWTIGNGLTPVADRLRAAITDVQHGRCADPRGWSVPVDGTNGGSDYG